MNFEEFSAACDLHGQSHRALTKQLIPAWLAKGAKDLDSKIESSGYGESPQGVLTTVLQHLELGPEDIFLDLGAGAGNVLSIAGPKCAQAYGIERNPKLVELGQAFLDAHPQDDHDLREGDFLSSEWPAANKLFAATARFSQETLKTLAQRISEHTPAVRVATLGRSIPLDRAWSLDHQQRFQVRWNRDEDALEEPLQVWVRLP